jgi:hypothetical protein
MKKFILLGSLIVLALSTRTDANLGTVTAGSISGVSADFGSGALTIDPTNGITIGTGSGTLNKIKWGGGVFVGSFASGDLRLNGDVVRLTDGTTNAFWAPSFGGFYPSSTSMTLGLSSAKWGSLWTNEIQLTGDLHMSGDLRWTPPTTTSSDQPVVYSTGNAILYRKTNAYSGTCSSPSSITVEGGIITGCS